MVYIEGLGNASIANGVVRIETLHRGARNEDVRGEDLIIPVGRLPALLQSLQALMRNTAPPAEKTAKSNEPMTEDQRLWAFALEVHRRHGENAMKFVAGKLNSLERQGNAAGVEAWQAIAARVDQLRQGQAGQRQ